MWRRSENKTHDRQFSQSFLRTVNEQRGGWRGWGAWPEARRGHSSWRPIKSPPMRRTKWTMWAKLRQRFVVCCFAQCADQCASSPFPAPLCHASLDVDNSDICVSQKYLALEFLWRRRLPFARWPLKSVLAQACASISHAFRLRWNVACVIRAVGRIQQRPLGTESGMLCRSYLWNLMRIYRVLKKL